MRGDSAGSGERPASPTPRRWFPVCNWSAIAGFGASVLLGAHSDEVIPDFWSPQYPQKQHRSCNAPDEQAHNENSVCEVCVVHCQQNRSDRRQNAVNNAASHKHNTRPVPTTMKKVAQDDEQNPKQVEHNEIAPRPRVHPVVNIPKPSAERVRSATADDSDPESSNQETEKLRPLHKRASYAQPVHWTAAVVVCVRLLRSIPVEILVGG